MPDQFPLAQVPLQGADTLDQQAPAALGSRTLPAQQPSVFGGKLLPERGLLANVLLAGLLGLGAGAGARNPLEAVAAGGFAPFQFKLQQRARQREEEAEEERRGQAQERLNLEGRRVTELEKGGRRAELATFLQSTETIQRIAFASDKHDAAVLEATGQFLRNVPGDVFTDKEVKNFNPTQQAQFGKRAFFPLPGGKVLFPKDLKAILPSQEIDLLGGKFTLPTARADQQHAILLDHLDTSSKKALLNATGQDATDLGKDLAFDVIDDPRAKINGVTFAPKAQRLLIEEGAKRGYNGETRAAAQNVLNGLFTGITTSQSPEALVPPRDLPPSDQDKGDIVRGQQGLVLGGLTEGNLAKLRQDNSALADHIQLDPNNPGKGKINIQGPLSEEALETIRKLLLTSGIIIE